MNETEARQLVAATISGYTITDVQDFGELYCVIFENNEYLESGEFGDLKVGAGPAFVEKATGKVFPTGSARSTELSVKAYEESGNLYANPSKTIRLSGFDNHTKNGVVLTIKNTLSIERSKAKSIYETLDGGGTVEFNLRTVREAADVEPILRAAGILAKIVWE